MNSYSPGLEGIVAGETAISTVGKKGRGLSHREHESNASTFSARVTTSTLSDFYAAVTAAIGTLRGPLHGGANEEAMRLIDRFATPDEAEVAVRTMIAGRACVPTGTHPMPVRASRGQPVTQPAEGYGSRSWPWPGNPAIPAP